MATQRVLEGRPKHSSYRLSTCCLVRSKTHSSWAPCRPAVKEVKPGKTKFQNPAKYHITMLAAQGRPFYLVVRSFTTCSPASPSPPRRDCTAATTRPRRPCITHTHTHTHKSFSQSAPHVSGLSERAFLAGNGNGRAMLHCFPWAGSASLSRSLTCNAAGTSDSLTKLTILFLSHPAPDSGAVHNQPFSSCPTQPVQKMGYMIDLGTRTADTATELHFPT
jgi:hypothetical protein